MYLDQSKRVLSLARGRPFPRHWMPFPIRFLAILSYYFFLHTFLPFGLVKHNLEQQSVLAVHTLLLARQT